MAVKEYYKDKIFTFHYVSIKSGDALGMTTGAIRFTFHYVSIKSNISQEESSRKLIYIPLCIY